MTVFEEEPKDREYFTKRTSSSLYLRCLECKSLKLSPCPDLRETNTFYTPEYQNYEEVKAPLISHLFLLLQHYSTKSFLKQVSRNARILDFGCNQGQFLRSLSLHGQKDLYGYEVVDIEERNKKKFTYIGTLEELNGLNVKFDVIRMNHVIEHLPNLEEVMSILSSLLSDKGVIIGQMPNADHYTARIFRSFWGPLHFPYHVNLFSPKGIEVSSSRWGLEVEEIQCSFMPTGWAMSFENIYKQLVSSKKKGRTNLYVFFVFLGAPFAILDKFLSTFLSTAIIDFRLKKRNR